MDAKEELLKHTGFKYNFDRMVYLNRASRKLFSVEAIEDHSFEWLRDRIAEAPDEAWQFYFNEAPPPAVIREFLVELEQHAAG